MAIQGIKILDLPELYTLPKEENCYFITTKGNTTNKISTKTLYFDISGITSAYNTGNGIGIFKGFDSLNEKSILFYSLTGTDGIESSLNQTSNLINLNIKNDSITNSKIKDNQITPNKLIGTFTNSIIKTDIQEIPKLTSVFIDNFSLSINVHSVNAKVMLTGSISIGGEYCYIDILRQTPQNSEFVRLVNPGSVPTGYEFFMYDGSTNGTGLTDSSNFDIKVVPISIIDSPQTNGVVTYKVRITNKDGDKAYINRAFKEKTLKKLSMSQLNAVILP
jgi:hypothetical protein